MTGKEMLIDMLEDIEHEKTTDISKNYCPDDLGIPMDYPGCKYEFDEEICPKCWKKALS